MLRFECNREQEEREERQRVRQALGIADDPDPMDPANGLDENDPFTTNLCAARPSWQWRPFYARICTDC